MIMRVTWGKIRPGKWEKFEALWKEHASETSGAAGLKGRWLLRDEDNKDAGYSLACWESNDHFEAYQASSESAYTKEMQDCFVGQYVTTPCDVRGHAGGEPS